MAQEHPDSLAGRLPAAMAGTATIPAHMEENIAAAGLRLTDAEVAALAP